MSYEIIRARGAGLFSNIFSVLGAAYWCEMNGVTPVVFFDTGYYLDKNKKDNWWEYYFEPLSNADLSTLDLSMSMVDYEYKYRNFSALMKLCERSLMSSLISKYIKVKKTIVDEADGIWKNLIIPGTKTVGVHVRGTDKYLERKRHKDVDLDAIYKKIDQEVMKVETGWKIFLATDDQEILNRFLKKYNAENVVYQNILRSINHAPIHRIISEKEWKTGPWRDMPWPQSVLTSGTTMRQLGKEALIDALLLSKCDKFMGNSSNMSYFVRGLNFPKACIYLDGDEWERL